MCTNNTLAASGDTLFVSSVLSTFELLICGASWSNKAVANTKQTRLQLELAIINVPCPAASKV